MLFDYYDTDRLIVCMDPANIDLLYDFCGDRATTRLLEIQCQFSDDYLIGHAMRVGLAGDHTPRDIIERLVPTIRNDIAFETDRIRDAEFDNHVRIRETDRPDQNAPAIAEFLSLPVDKGLEIAETDHLFAD